MRDKRANAKCQTRPHNESFDYFKFAGLSQRFGLVSDFILEFYQPTIKITFSVNVLKAGSI